MDVALETMSTYEDFVLEKDILYFRVGDHGLVSFHGKNFNLKRRVATDQLNKMIVNSSFFKVNMDSYANINKIYLIADGKVFFNPRTPDTKSIVVTALRQASLKELLSNNDTKPKPEDSLK
jgi:hypothetical protein